MALRKGMKQGLEWLLGTVIISVGAYVVGAGVGAGLGQVYSIVEPRYRFLPENQMVVASSREEKTLANEFLTQFPEKIPGVSSVWKYEVPAARYCLVHIRQMHSGYRSQREEQQGQELRAVQYDIYQILEALHQTRGIRGVYTENYMVEDRAGLEESIRRVRTSNPCTGALAKAAAAQQDCWKFKRWKAEQFGPEGYGAVDVLVVERKMEIYPAESREVRTGWLFLDLLFKNKAREDYLLTLVAQKDDPMAVTVYGASHDFGDNIAEWNEQHPDKKFSLIEIMPEALERVM